MFPGCRVMGVAVALYDAIGPGYRATRRADPGLAAALWRNLSGRPTARYLDIGCGTGNYTRELAACGGTWTGIDASAIMLREAERAHPGGSWLQAAAENLPFPDGVFGGAIATLVVHHFEALHRPFHEARRVLRGGCLVLFTALPEQMRRYWLCHYFPDMVARAARTMPSEADLCTALKETGFASVRIEPFHVTTALQDFFLYAGKQRPELYLDPAVRANISSFRTLCRVDELANGLCALTADLRSGEFQEVARRYDSPQGDYAFVVADTGVEPRAGMPLP